MQQEEILESPAPSGDTGVALSPKENRQIVTPYAFKVCPNLLGVPLATPIRRLIAILIDGLIVTGLAGASLICIVPFLAFLALRRWQAKVRSHVGIIAIAAIVLVPTAQLAPEYIREVEDSSEFQLDATSLMALTAFSLKVNEENCDKSCMDKAFFDIADEFGRKEIPKEETEKLLIAVLEETDYELSERPLLIQRVMANYSNSAVSHAPKTLQPKPTEQTATKPWYQPSPDTHSVIQWIQGIFSDLGISVGWMVAYFSLSIAWGNGQTLGKWLLGIQVIQVDGQPLSLFNAFSRQGGYGAGFATGMLGFLQIFWDPNRQAIQDKVSNTLVIRLGEAKRPLTH